MKIKNNENDAARTFDRKKLLMMSVGSFVGSGVVSILGVATSVTGYSVWLAYLLAVIIGFLTALPFVFMSSVMTFTGGTYTIANTFIGPTFGGAYIMSTFINGIGVALMAVAFGTYIQSVFPSANIRFFAVGILIVFWCVHCMGVDFMASVQKYSTYILLIALAIFCIIGFAQLDSAVFNFHGPKFMTGGSTGLIGATAMLSFSTQAYDMNTYPFGKYTIDSRKNMPWAMFATFLILILVYCGVAIAAVGSAGLDTFSGHPLTAPARVIMPGPLFYFFVVLGPVLCLTTTINGALANFTVTLEKATEDGWFNKSFASPNRRGASWKILSMLIIVCLIPILFSIDIGTLTKNVVLLHSCLQIPLLITLWKLPGKFPEAFENNTLGIKPSVYYMGMIIAIAARILIFSWSLVGLNMYNAIGSIMAVGLCFLFSFLRARTGRTQINDSYYFE